MSRPVFFLAMAWATAAILACSGDDQGPDSSPPSGIADEIRLSISSDPETLDPQLALLTSDLAVLRQLFRGLLWYDENLDLVPMVAREVPTTGNGGVSKDGLVYRFKLRDGVQWSDGQPVTARDFEYSLKRLLDPRTASPVAASFYDIRGAEELNSCLECSAQKLDQLLNDVGVKAETDSTLVITLRSPRASFPYLLISVAASPLRQDVVEAYGDGWASPEHLVSAGPFVLAEWIPESHLILESSEHWWGKEVRFNRLIINVIPNPADSFNAFLAGDLEAAMVPPDFQATVDADPGLRKQNMQQAQLVSFAYFMNNQVAPFTDKRVREAFSLAIDRDALLRDKTGAVNRIGYSWLPPGMPGHSEKLGRQWKFDPAEARKKLAEAGYPMGKGLPAIVYAYPGPDVDPFATFVRDQLRQNLGVDITLEPVTLDAWRERFFSADLQLTITAWSSEYADPEAFLRDPWTCQRYSGDECMSFAGANFARYANPEFDRRMEQAAKEIDAQRRLALYAEAEKILIADAPAIFVGHLSGSILVKPYLGGAIHTPLDTMPMEFFLDRVYIKD